ncbi:alpha/beta hydrolase [Curtobacterium sp. MCLR17_007]|uniref:alpha/beta fold hydrolase n=1 Tax=Curtobacterium sp. MCLR17_007 TaxID=2175648 RepID=UPI0015E89EA1|nr:alpha/beta hydrolase [Curtobacterium sp. MCLR17_007]WIB61862.1 alpha/beta hydrolase [Curtobacterium sp. MCLR17_007]
MLLNVVVQGRGERNAVLLHGMMGSHESWQRVVPLLVSSGYRVHAVDLPGHGMSPSDDTMTVDRAARSVADSLANGCGTVPDLVIGHSYGGLLLAAAVSSGVLAPRLSVYVDTPFAAGGGGRDRDELVAAYEEDARLRTYAGLRASRPFYSEQDCEVEARAAQRFDPPTAVAQSMGARMSFEPEAGSIIVRADPSRYVDDETAALHSARGVAVRDVPGAAHSVWYSHFDEFIAALPEVFQ